MSRQKAPQILKIQPENELKFKGKFYCNYFNCMIIQYLS